MLSDVPGRENIEIHLLTVLDASWIFICPRVLVSGSFYRVNGPMDTTSGELSMFCNHQSLENQFVHWNSVEQKWNSVNIEPVSRSCVAGSRKNVVLRATRTKPLHAKSSINVFYGNPGRIFDISSYDKTGACTSSPRNASGISMSVR